MITAANKKINSPMPETQNIEYKQSWRDEIIL